eukprot:TRINITY_DN3150_c0_g2_i1.p1 TRINITY_DN3150_c0_g2~~TRINITY_DN3150_c0_g2_i1.p1  ORF type:complete len:1100 (+),score=326.01 TRINITY_DN3150_c0_g2_i1:71-3301(+)
MAEQAQATDLYCTNEQFAQVMVALTMPDTKTVKEATEVMNKLLSRHECIGVLLFVLQNSQQEQLRQLAAVLMRKRICGHWGKLTPELRASVQATLLRCVVAEASSPVRRSASEVVGVLSRMTLPAGAWPELLPFLHQCIQSTNNDHKEAALKLFGLITDIITMGDSGQQLKPVITNLLGRELANASNSPNVRLAALIAVGSLVPQFETEEEVLMFRDGLLPHLIEVVRYCIQHNLDDYVVDSFSVFDDLMEMPLQAVMSCMPPLVRFAVEVASSKLEFTSRMMALSFVEWVSRYKPKLITHDLLQQIVMILLNLSAEPEDDGMDDTSPHQFATQMFDQLAYWLPSRLMFQTVIAAIPPLLQSTNFLHRKAALATLASLCENCTESFRTHLAELVPRIVACFRDAEKQVREVAFCCMGEFASHLKPEIVDYHAQILPGIFESTVDTDYEVQRKSCLVLEVFASNLGPKIEPYVPALMQRLGALLQQGPAKLRDVVIMVIGSTADSAKASFLPYFGQLMPFLQQVITLKAEGDIILRGRGLECMACVAKAVGRDAFTPYVNDYMSAALESISINSTFQFELLEMTFGSLSDMVEVLKDQFLPYLPKFMPHLINMMDSTDGYTAEPPEEEVVEGDSGTGGIESDEDDEAEEEPVNMSYDVAFAEAKAAACFCVGMVARELTPHFVPYAEKTLGSMKKLGDHVDGEVRQAVANALQFFVKVSTTCFPPSADPQEVHPSTRAVLDVVMGVLLDQLHNDEERDVVIQALDSIAYIIKEVKVAGVAPYYETLTQGLMNVLQKKAPCQSADSDEPASQSQSGDDDADEDKEIELHETVGAVVVELAHVFGKQLQPFFMQALPFFVRMMRPSNHMYYRGLSVGTIAEYVKITGVDTQELLPSVMPAICAGLQDPNKKVRHNSAFAVGLLLAGAGPRVTAYHGQALQLLRPLLAEGSPRRTRDNAVGAVARIITAQGALLPLDQMIPVLLESLPLRRDMEENEPVYTCIVGLFRDHLDKIAPHMLRVLQIFGQVLGPQQQLEAPLRQQLVLLLRSLVAQFPQRMQELVAGLPAEQQAALGACINGN